MNEVFGRFQMTELSWGKFTKPDTNFASLDSLNLASKAVMQSEGVLRTHC